MVDSEEKQRDDMYWQEFAETGKMPDLPNSLVMEKGDAYIVQFLRAPYNALTKVLVCEVLARQGKLDAEGEVVQLAEAKWLHFMILSKKRKFEKRNEMESAIEAFFARSKNPKIVQFSVYIKKERKLRDWLSRAQKIYQELPESSNQVLPLINEFNKYSSIYLEVCKEAKFRKDVLFWLSILMEKMKKISANIDIKLERSFVRALRKDGLENIPEICWERQLKSMPPTKGKNYNPAIIERVVVGLYEIIKNVYGNRLGKRTKAELELMNWVLVLLRQTAEKLPDEWSDFRIGKLLMFMGRIDEAKTLLMPIIRKKQAEFWAWNILGKLYPEFRKECIAKALLSRGIDQMKVRVKKEAQELQLPVTDENALVKIAEKAEDLLLEGMPFEEGVLNCYFINKEGKKRVTFILKSGINLKPTSPLSIHLPINLPLGTPVNIYLDEEDPLRIVAVRLRDGDLWDVLPAEKMVYYGISKKGRAMLAFDNGEFTCSIQKFACLNNAEFGDEVLVRYTTYEADFGMVYDVKSIELTGNRSSRTFGFKGELKLPYGIKGSGFVNQIYVSPTLLITRNGEEFTDGTPVHGLALRLTPRDEVDRYGITRTVTPMTALKIAKITGIELEQYIIQRI